MFENKRFLKQVELSFYRKLLIYKYLQFWHCN